MSAVGRISLHCVDQGAELRGQAFFDAGLCPVDTEAPVSWACGGTVVLLEDGCGDASLGRSVLAPLLINHINHNIIPS